MVATTISNNNQIVRTIRTGEGEPSDSMVDIDSNISASREVSTVNTNRLKQIFDTYRNVHDPKSPANMTQA